MTTSIIYLIILTFIVVASFIFLLKAILSLSTKVEKLNKTQATMMSWFETLRKNDETLSRNLKHINNEFKELQKQKYTKN